MIKDGYGLTFTEIKDFMSSLTENYDPELCNIHIKKRVLDNNGDTIQFCLSYRGSTKDGTNIRFVFEISNNSIRFDSIRFDSIRNSTIRSYVNEYR